MFWKVEKRYMKRFRLKPNCALAQKSVGKKLLKRVSSDELSIQQYRSTCTQLIYMSAKSAHILPK